MNPDPVALPLIPIEGLDEEVRQLDLRLGRIRQELVLRDERINELSQHLSQRDQRLEQSRADLLRKQDLLAERERELAAARVEGVSLAGQLTRLQAELQSSLDAMHSRIGSLEAEARGHEEEIERLREVIRGQDREVGRLYFQVGEGERRIARLEGMPEPSLRNWLRTVWHAAALFLLVPIQWLLAPFRFLRARFRWKWLHPVRSRTLGFINLLILLAASLLLFCYLAVFERIRRWRGHRNYRVFP